MELPLEETCDQAYASVMKRLNRILIVEDEPLISMMLENFLECLDREVMGSADTVRDALDIIASGDVDAVILDLHLIGGEKSTPIAVELNARGIPFILASGGSTNVDDVFANAPLLLKPFTIQGMESAFASIESSLPEVRAA